MDKVTFINNILAAVRQRFRLTEELDDNQARRIIIEEVFNDSRSENLSDGEIDECISRIFYKTRCRLGIIQPLIEDNEVSEIMVNGPENIFVERGGTIEKYGFSFDSTEELEEVIRNVAGDVHREISEMNPIVDARLADGSRVSGVYKNIAVGGPILTIRKFSDKYMKMADLQSGGTVSAEGARLLETLVACGYNIFVSGGTSSGKTTLLNALADSIPAEERVIVIEDSTELKLSGIENIVHMECRNSNASGKGEVTMSQLIKSSLRMRPDRIIVGEVRGPEVADMLQAMNTGHAGSMSTGHGNSVPGMLRRLESMYLMAVSLDIDAVRAQIAEGIDIMVHIEKMEGAKRRIIEITEVCGYSNGQFRLNTLMAEKGDGQLLHTGNSLENTRKIFLKGGHYAEILRQSGFVR